MIDYLPLGIGGWGAEVFNSRTLWEASTVWMGGGKWLQSVNGD
jgi:hypothetical protein